MQVIDAGMYTGWYLPRGIQGGAYTQGGYTTMVHREVYSREDIHHVTQGSI